MHHSVQWAMTMKGNGKGMGGHTTSNLVGRAHSNPLYLGTLFNLGDFVLCEVAVEDVPISGHHGL
jgi:hypothetical protein